VVPDTFGCGNVGANTVTLTVEDECGNQAQCTATVTVEDNVPPELYCQDFVIAPDETGVACITPADVIYAVTEACGIASTTVTPECFTLAEAGDNPVTVTVTDVNGNTSTCDATVTVGGTIHVRVERHFVQCGTYPGAQKEAYEGLLVGVYDKSEGSCARAGCGGISWQNYPCIFATCPPVPGTVVVGTSSSPGYAQGYTDANGEITFHVPAGDYLVVGGDTDHDKHLGVSASDLAAGMYMQKYLQELIKCDGSSSPAKRTKKEGSVLYIIEPEYVEWSGTAEYYPFTFDAEGTWDIAVSVAPPEGFLADHEILEATPSDSFNAVQFQITDIGSEWVNTGVSMTIKHKGKSIEHRSDVGVAMTPELAKQKGRPDLAVKKFGPPFIPPRRPAKKGRPEGITPPVPPVTPPGRK
jgi:hypothetical protein